MSGEGKADTHLPPGRMLGPYEIRKLLGSGAFADVYLARHKLLEKDFALKVIRTPEAERWEKEGAKIMCRLRHPNVVSVHFADRIDGVLVIAMDYVEGRTLRDLLRERGRMEAAEALRIAASVASALDYVHSLEGEGSSHVAHLDLKPSNILIDASGTVKITDFGMAQCAGTALSGGPAVAGSPAYMAPEQFEGRPSPGADLWAVGVVLFEMLLGRTPYRGATF